VAMCILEVAGAVCRYMVGWVFIFCISVQAHVFVQRWETFIDLYCILPQIRPFVLFYVPFVRFMCMVW